MNVLLLTACAALGQPGGLELLGKGKVDAIPEHMSLSPDGKTAHLSSTNHYIYDITRQVPRLVGTFRADRSRTHAIVDRNTVYVGEDSLISIVDVTTPSNPVSVGSFGGNALDMGLYKDHLYVVNAVQKTLTVFDVSNPSFPTKVWEEEWPAPSVVSLSIVSGHAYVGTEGTQKLVIYDLSTPSAPVKLAFNSISGPDSSSLVVRSIKQVGKRAYFAFGEGGLVVFDVEDPAEPVMLGMWKEDNIRVADVAVKDGVAYLAEEASTSGLYAIDASNPMSLQRVASYDDASFAGAVAVWGDRLILWGPTLCHYKLSRSCQTRVRVNGEEVAKLALGERNTISLSGMTWGGFTLWAAGADAFELPAPLPAKATVELRCCGGEECEFFFTLFHCEACTGPRPAGLAQTLLLDGWESGQCGPYFGDGFKSTAFRKHVDARGGEVVLSYKARHNEIAAVFAQEGDSVMRDRQWCVRPRGPVAPGPGCGARCPQL